MSEQPPQGRLQKMGIERGAAVPLSIEGADVVAFAGETVAASSLASGHRILRYTAKKGEPRGLYCGIGLCHDCAVEVDGKPGVRTCMLPVESGNLCADLGFSRTACPERSTSQQPSGQTETRDVIIIGGGPAGMAAASELARQGLAVILVEERPQLGGQVYRRPPPEFSVAAPSVQGKHFKDGAKLIAETLASSAEILVGHTAWGIWKDDDAFRVAVAGSNGHNATYHAPQLIVASGAYDRPFPFPGWTLPGVMTAGGAQQLAKAQRVAPGKRVVIAGSGPLIPFFAVELHKLGVNIVAVAEAAPRPGLRAAGRFVLGALAGGAAGLLLEGAGYLSYLRRHGIPIHWGTAIAEARGEKVVDEVVLRSVDDAWRPVPNSEFVVEADCLCVNYGFMPSTEVAALLGCEFENNEQLGGRIPTRTPYMETSIPGLYAAGDGAGIGGSVLARLEGRIAGLAAVLRAGKGSRAVKSQVAAHVRAAKRFRRFKAALDVLYRMGPGIRSWWSGETTLCRCEEVSYGEVLEIAQTVSDPNLVKVLTRAGMGRCQGRYCHDNLMHVLSPAGQSSSVRLTPRLPVKPVPLSAIANEAVSPRRNVPHGKQR